MSDEITKQVIIEKIVFKDPPQSETEKSIQDLNLKLIDDISNLKIVKEHLKSEIGDLEYKLENLKEEIVLFSNEINASLQNYIYNIKQDTDNYRQSALHDLDYFHKIIKNSIANMIDGVNK